MAPTSTVNVRIADLKRFSSLTPRRPRMSEPADIEFPHDEILYDPRVERTNPWLLPDQNPMPRLRLFGRKRKRGRK